MLFSSLFLCTRTIVYVPAVLQLPSFRIKLKLLCVRERIATWNLHQHWSFQKWHARILRISDICWWHLPFRTDGRESPILAESDADGHSDKPRSKYGELVILGWVTFTNTFSNLIALNSKPNKLILRYNGFLPQGDRGRRRSKFVLTKRSEHNGVKRSKHYIVQSPETSHAILDATQHSISYTLSRNQAVIVEYQEDENTDMFQVPKTSINSWQRNLNFSFSFRSVDHRNLR